MSIEIEISTAKDSDLPGLMYLVNSAYRGETSRHGWTHESDLLDGQRTDGAVLQETIEKPDSLILLAKRKDTGELVGCVQVEKHVDACYLSMLTVSPTLQNQGLGRKLVQAHRLVRKTWISCYRRKQALPLWRRTFRKAQERKPSL
jgi:ribosomal protein S18 acetylase RimI-like enzyme